MPDLYSGADGYISLADDCSDSKLQTNSNVVILGGSVAGTEHLPMLQQCILFRFFADRKFIKLKYKCGLQCLLHCKID